MEDPLAALRWHWGDAYDITHPAPDKWLAVRKDNHATLRAKGPEQLRDRIRADYRDHRVKRSPGA